MCDSQPASPGRTREESGLPRPEEPLAQAPHLVMLSTKQDMFFDNMTNFNESIT